MDKLKRNELDKKIKRYDELSNSINNIIHFVNFPDYVFNKYNGQEECSIKLVISYGNGSMSEVLTVTERDNIFKNIISELTILKEMYEQEIEKL